MADGVSLSDQVRSLTWFHQIELPGGLVTPGAAENQRQLPRLGLPDRLDGKTVLDVGAWDGFFSFECARRGASRVLATDSYVWESDRFSQNRGFLLAREALGYSDVVEDQFVDVMDLSPERVGGSFDVVLFLGVLYHVKDPVTAIERVASVCRDLLVVETETSLNWVPYAASRLYPGSELAHDDTNWWALNVRAIVGLLRRVGFRDITLRGRTPMRQRLAWAARAGGKGQSFRSQLRSQRVVLHARKGT